MLNIFARASVARVTDPVGGWLVRAGLTPNAMTVIGTVASALAAVLFIPRGGIWLFVGSALVTVFVMFDLLDGAMARTAGKVTRYGSVLDASCDRIADGVLFGCIAWWCFVVADDRITGIAALICLAGAQIVSYIKARAEAAGLAADGGLVERAERFIIALVGTGIQGLGVPHAVDVAMWLLAVGVLITIGQRMTAVYRSAQAQEAKEAAGEDGP
ncbi:MAG TPA: CDP-alcohol phosphatidyltransferase family protein [Pseudonocardiaceae bacterium]|jgi:CDP-diacylglycerol--glycerol-3-phosphate 3-phosphatidyltransferase|nr:CDP-alcohol phosphatidyltransferase family protein [Pseudonocardiaceae bacterium]